jgi:hypothetical protein
MLVYTAREGNSSGICGGEYSSSDRDFLAVCERLTAKLGESLAVDEASKRLVTVIWGTGMTTLREALKNPLPNPPAPEDMVADSLLGFTGAVASDVARLVECNWYTPDEASILESEFNTALANSTLGHFMVAHRQTELAA